MKIIDAHLHFVPENPYFQEIAVRAEHKNTEEDLRAVYQKYNIEEESSWETGAWTRWIIPTRNS